MLPNKYESYERKVKVMRKLIVFMLIAMLATSLVGCSGEEKPSNSDTSTNSEEITNEVNDESDDNSNDNVTYTLYDDLSSYVKIIYHDIYISTPLWREDKVVNGYSLTDSNDYAVCITYNVDEEYTGALDDILDDTYDEFTNAISDRSNAREFGEYNLTTKEKVTLDCGAEAIKFEGTITAEEYSDVVDYYIYGYSFVYDGATITVGTSIVEPEVIDTQKDTMKDIIDRMVKTIRTEL